MATKRARRKNDYTAEERLLYWQTRFPGLNLRLDSNVSVLCPLHDDNDPSLSIHPEKGWKCHAGCGDGGIVQFEERFSHCDYNAARKTIAVIVGLPVPRETGPPPAGEPEAIYEYFDEHRKLIFRKLRFPGKRMINQQSAGDSWVNHLHGIKEKPLYGLPALITADTVFIAEGEKDCDSLRNLHLEKFDPYSRFAYVTNFDGAECWRKSDTRYFHGKNVVVFGDNDDKGRKRVRTIAHSLVGIATEIKLIEFPEMPEKSDVTNWIEEHSDNEGDPGYQLWNLIKRTEVWKADTDSASSLFHTAQELAEKTTPETAWLVGHLIPEGAMVNVEAKVKTGKTTFTLAMLRAVLDGTPFLGQPTVQTPVVYLSEQGEASFKAALRKANLLGRPDFHYLLRNEVMGKPWPEVAALAIEQAKRIGSRLLVVDTLGRFAGLKEEDENNSGAYMEALDYLEAAIAANITDINLVHGRKSGGAVEDSTRGSSALPGAADTLFSLRRPEGKHGETFRRLESISRFDETLSGLTLELTPEGYVSHGDSAAVALEQARTKLDDFLPDSEGDAATAAKLAESAGCTQRTMKRVLEERPDITRIGAGKKGDPYRFYRGSSTTIQ